jgi:cell division protein FtsA
MGVFESRAAWRKQAEAADASLIAGLDIGCGKIACLLAANSAGPMDAPIALAGAGWVGMRRTPDGGGGDFETAVRAIRVALDQAERMAGGTSAREAVVSYSGPDLQTARIENGVTFARRAIQARDVTAAIQTAIARGGLNNRRVLHIAPLGYRVDGGDLTPDPRGQIGRKLDALLALVHAPETAIEALEACVSQAGIGLREIVAAPYAAGLAVLSDDERAEGAAVLDWGAGQMGYGLFVEGALLHAETIAAPGAKLTRALAQRLGTTFAAAERTKILHGDVGAPANARDIVEVPVLGADGRLELGAVRRADIIAALREGSEQALRQSAARHGAIEHLWGEAPTPVALTGGGAQMAGLRALSEDILERPVRLGGPEGFAGFDDTEFAPALSVSAGLLRYAHMMGALAPQQSAVRRPAAALSSQMRASFSTAVTWLKENF